MKVLHVTHQYRPAIGGSERYLTDISEELVRRGHEVDVVTSRSNGVTMWANELPRFEQLGGVNIHRFWSVPQGTLNWHLLRLGNQARRRGLGGLSDPLILAGTGPVTPGIVNFILKHGHTYDLIHIQTLPFAHVVYGYLSARMTGRPIVITPHAHVEHAFTFDLPAFNRALRGASMVFIVTEREVPYLQARGVNTDQIRLIGNGIPAETIQPCGRRSSLDEYNLPEHPFIVLFLGRKEAHKGLDSLVTTVAELAVQFPSIRLISAGPETAHSQELRASFGHLECWINVGPVSDDEKSDLLSACDVLALPSTGEAFGIVFLEAWSRGKPVIGARSGGIPWVIEDDVDGLLVEPGNTLELSQALQRLIQAPELRHRLGLAGQRKTAERFTVTRVVDRVEAAYGELVSSHDLSAVRK
ncbi:MAG: glycosyltransferase family 4 protein [Chloroflexota bacterium]